MVKTKGFTLIELMVVIAIVGILLSLVLGPARDKYSSTRDTGWNGDMSESTSASKSEADIIINGIPHTCDPLGNCKPSN